MFDHLHGISCTKVTIVCHTSRPRPFTYTSLSSFLLYLFTWKLWIDIQNQIWYFSSSLIDFFMTFALQLSYSVVSLLTSITVLETPSDSFLLDFCEAHDRSPLHVILPSRDIIYTYFVAVEQQSRGSVAIHIFVFLS